MTYDKGVEFNNSDLPDIVELKNISMSYDGGKNFIIKDLNFLVEDKPNQGQFVVILGLSGCGKCIAKGTWIRTPNGIRLIEDIVQHREIDKVLLNNSEVVVNGRIEAISHVYYGGVKDTIVLTTLDGDMLEGLGTHPVKLWDKNNFCLTFKEINDVSIGDFMIKDDKSSFKFVSSNKKQKLPTFKDSKVEKRKEAKILYKKLGSTYKVAKVMQIAQTTAYRMVFDKYRNRMHLKCPTYLDNSVAYYLGLIMGDGSITNKFSITNADQEIISFVKNFHEKYLGVGTSITTKKGTKAVLIRPLDIDHVHRWLDEITGRGYTSNDKIIPRVIALADYNHQISFVKGLFDSDGYGCSKYKRIEISLNSQNLIVFIANILSSLSIGYTLRKNKKSYRVSVRRSDNWKYLFKLERKKPLFKNKVEFQSHYDIIPGSRIIFEQALKGVTLSRKELKTISTNVRYSKKDLQRGSYLRCKKLLSGKGIILPEIPYFRFVKVTNKTCSKNEIFDITNPISQEYIANGYAVHNSTLLRFICGLQEPTSGEILVRGKPKDEDTRIGMVFQQYSSFPWLSVVDNVALGLKYKGVPKKQRHEKAMEMIKIVGLEGHEKKYAKYPTLSGGQLQRVAIARSLVADPEILLMDEPFCSLDLNTRLQMQDLLCEIWTKLQSTIIFVTHDLPEAVYLGDDIYIMRACPGMIVEKIKVDLPLKRDRDIKRTTKFMDIVNNVENKMISIQHFMDDEKKK